VLDCSLPAQRLDLQRRLGGRRDLRSFSSLDNGDIPMSVQAMKAGAASS